ncbi:MAG: PAS domain S-box protein [Sediminicola sp.]
MWEEIVTGQGKRALSEMVSKCFENPGQLQKSTIDLIDVLGNDMWWKVVAYTIDIAPDSRGCVLLFPTTGSGSVQRVQRLENDIKKLSTLRDILYETNEIARIGGWEIDLLKNEITWTKLTRDIHEVPEDYRPIFAESINFYMEGWSRDLITKVFTLAVEKGIPFDEELKLKTFKGRDIWVRSFGKPEFENGKCVRVYGAFQDIDEKKEKELEFNTTKELYEKIFDHSSVGIVLTSRDGEILRMNPAGLRIFGLDPAEGKMAINLTYRDVVHPESMEEITALRSKLLSGEIDHYKMESRISTVTGDFIWCAINTSIFSQNSGEDLIITTLEDISERKNLEKIAHENAKRFKNVFEFSPNGMGVVNTAGTWEMANKNLASIIGLNKEELMRSDFASITHPDDVHNDAELLKELIKGERESFSIGKRYIHKNGSLVHCILNVSSLKDEMGHTHSLIGQIVDITDTVRSQKALQKSLKDLQGLMDATTQVSIVETDLKGSVRKFNKGAENLLGYEATEVVDTLAYEHLHDKEEITQSALELSKEYGRQLKGFDVVTVKARSGTFESREWTYVRKDGSRFPVQLVVTAIRDEENKITGYLGVATDISQLKMMERSLREEKINADAANRSKSEFLANMSHEIRTPLNGVIGFTDLLMKTDLSETQMNYMRTVFNSANSLLDLINDILDFSKIEAGKLELHNEKTDIFELCSQALDIIKYQAHAKGIELLINIPSDVKRFVYTDAVRLRQIVTNLLGNAVKFTQKGEIELKIVIGETEDPSNLIYDFAIRDTGIGIAPENLEKIFHAFDQEDGSTTRKYGGTGLGLTISNRLLELMDSKLQVESSLHIGSTFHFQLELKTANGESLYVNSAKKIKKVLIVDDNESNRLILEGMLAVDKIASRSVSNAIKAIELLEGPNTFDLAIIDYHMPYMNGLDLIRHLREELHYTADKLPVILLHSSGDDEIVNKGCKELKVQANVVKPIQLSRLYGLINTIRDPYHINETPTNEPEPTDDLSNLSFQIMVAEDNPINKYLTRTILQKLLPNSTLIEVNNGQEAIEAYKSHNLDMILMDIEMPILSGFEASKAIRKLEKSLIHIPIIALTARTVKGERERCMGYGMDDYVTKPVVLETIGKLIRTYLVKGA